MDDERFQKRISQTVVDIYPLDRMLPAETVYSIFVMEYARSNDKNLFFRDKKFQRLREGYFALFPILALKDLSGKEHYLMFPSDPSNDVYTFYVKEEAESKFVGYKLDIKEFTNFSDSFVSFVEKVIIPKLDIYNIVIGTYRKIEGKDLKFLSDHLKNKDSGVKIWLVASPTEENDNENVARVVAIGKEGVFYDKIINLDEWIDKSKPVKIYQDVIRIK